MSDRKDNNLDVIKQIRDISKQTFIDLAKNLEMKATAGQLKLTIDMESIDKSMFSKDVDISRSHLEITLNLEDIEWNSK